MKVWKMTNFLNIKEPSIQGQEPMGSQSTYLLLFTVMIKGIHFSKRSASVSSAHSGGNQKSSGSHNG